MRPNFLQQSTSITPLTLPFLSRHSPNLLPIIPDLPAGPVCELLSSVEPGTAGVYLGRRLPLLLPRGLNNSHLRTTLGHWLQEWHTLISRRGKKLSSHAVASMSGVRPEEIEPEGLTGHDTREEVTSSKIMDKIDDMLKLGNPNPHYPAQTGTAATPRPASRRSQAHRIEPPATASGLSFAQRAANMPRPWGPLIIEGNNLMRNIERPLPGDTFGPTKNQAKASSTARRDAYFDHEFAATNRDVDSLKDRLQSEAMVVAEFKFNLCIREEYIFMRDLGMQLSTRYHRPMPSIVVTLDGGSTAMLFGGSFDPCYLLTIHALPHLVQPTMNKRNAAMIQRWIEEAVGVPPSRGCIRFIAIPEENIAIGGKTLATEVEDMRRGTDKLALSRKSSSKLGRKLSFKTFRNMKTSSMVELTERASTTTAASTPVDSQIATIPEVPPTPPEDEGARDLPEQKARKVPPRRKSFRFPLFGSKED
ncbi:hypothetical protein F5Y15DRAFT_366102 [Xylariaceae sp. FL0016]|nr:hypothetical protein F5Y15DRAFT_366102 [Xylariaceae sp. FL0016]